MPRFQRRSAVRVARAAALVAFGAAGLPLSGCASILGIEEWDPQGEATSSSATSSASSVTSSATGSGAGAAGGGGSSSSSTGTGGTGGDPVPGTAIVLDGLDDYVEFKPTAVFTPATGFTWELWFRGDAVPTSELVGGPAQMLFSAMDGEACEDIFLGFGSAFTKGKELTFEVDREGDCAGVDSIPARFSGFSSNTWYHIVAVADYANNDTMLYVNGVLQGMSGLQGAPITRDLLISAGRWTNGRMGMAFFDGSIDELRVYSGALAPQTIVEHYNASKGTYGSMVDPGIIAGWHFDEGANATAFDFGPGAAFGTLTSGASWGPGLVLIP
jgi:hypothetical protein